MPGGDRPQAAHDRPEIRGVNARETRGRGAGRSDQEERVSRKTGAPPGGLIAHVPPAAGRQRPKTGEPVRAADRGAMRPGRNRAPLPAPRRRDLAHRHDDAQAAARIADRVHRARRGGGARSPPPRGSRTRRRTFPSSSNATRRSSRPTPRTRGPAPSTARRASDVGDPSSRLSSVMWIRPVVKTTIGPSSPLRGGLT